MPRYTVYQRVLRISEDYLGPAAPRFLGRLVSGHLGKPATRISRHDLPDLIVWIRLAATLITDNEALINEYMQRLEQLSSSQADSDATGDDKRPSGQSSNSFSSHQSTVA
jgi:hypothetical protein